MKTLGLAALGGGIAALVVWAYARRSLDAVLSAGKAKLAQEFTAGGQDLHARLERGRLELSQQLKAQINAQVPPMVSRAIRAELGRYGITPERAQQIARVWTQAERLGLV